MRVGWYRAMGWIGAWMVFSGLAAGPMAAQVATPESPTPASPAVQPRKLALGVLRVIQPEIQVTETFTGPDKLVELATQRQLDWTPHFAAKTRALYRRAQEVTLRREVWAFEFAFKPLRVVMVDIPQPSGRMQRKPVWYMVYRVRYRGGNLAPQKQEDGTVAPVVTEHPQGRIFFPQFLLTAHELKETYFDQVIPAAMEVITKREKPDGPLHDSVTIASKPIPLTREEDAPGVWGVAMWQDVDPRIDFLSIDVKGLTNAYRPVDPPGAYKPGDPAGTGRQLLSKTLRLYFWKPGDSVEETEDEVHFGIPVEEDPDRQADLLRVYGVQRRVDYEWVYR